MQSTGEIVDELPVGYVFFIEQFKEECIPASSRSYRSSQIVGERRQK